MTDLVYPRERTLGAITLTIGLIIWLALIVGTFGIALALLAFGFILIEGKGPGMGIFLPSRSVRVIRRSMSGGSAA